MSHKKILLFILLCFTTLHAQDKTPEALSYCFKMALQNNIDIQVQEPLSEIAHQDLRFAQSPFEDILLFGEYSFEKTETLFLQEDDGNFSLGLAKRFLPGTEVSVRYDLQYLRSSDIDDSAELELILDQIGLDGDDDLIIQKLWSSAATLQVTQPLLRNFGVDVNSTSINLARKQKRIAEYEIERQVNDTLSQVEIAYWTWINFLKIKDVLLRSIDNAERYKKVFVEPKAMRVEGVLPSDVDQALIDIKKRKDLLITTERQIEVWADRLRRLIYPFDHQNMQLFGQKLPDWQEGAKLFELAAQQDFSLKVPTLNYKRALEYRPELKQLEEQVASTQLVVEERKNLLLPRLDITASVSAIGQEEGTNTAIERTFKGEFYQWQAGVVFEYPLGNTAARSQLRKARTEVKRGKRQLSQAQYNISLQLREAWHQVNEAVRKYENTKIILNKSQERLDALERRNKNPLPGDFNLIFFLQNAELQTTEAYSDLYEAVLQYKVALAQFKQAEARYLSEVYSKYKK